MTLTDEDVYLKYVDVCAIVEVGAVEWLYSSLIEISRQNVQHLPDW